MDDDGARADSANAARYDSLIAALSNEQLPITTDVCVASCLEAANDAQRQESLAALTDKCVRCAQLIAKSLEASNTLSRLQTTLSSTNEQNQEEGHNEVESVDEIQEDDEATTLLLQDLVAAGDEVEDAVTKCAQLGIVRKTAQASHKLLALAECNMNEHRVNNPVASKDDAVPHAFRHLYMDEFTTVFGDELDHFRQEQQFESKDVSYLISCIEAGGDIFSPLQKQLFVESVEATESIISESQKASTQL